MTAPRDPRKDPQPGDETKDNAFTWTVVARNGDRVKAIDQHGDAEEMDVDEWQIVASDDTVLRVAGEPDSPLVARSDKAVEPAIRVKRLHPEAKLPTRKHPYDAGLDLYSIDSRSAFRGEMPKVFEINTGIAVEIPKGYVGLVCDRSSMARRGLTIAGKVIDHGYTGLIVVVFHRSVDDCTDAINVGDKIAQLIIVPCLTLAVIEVDELSQSERGDKGFGSSGR